MMNVHVVIPAYYPSPELPHLVADLLLQAPTAKVLVLDDGSGPDYNDVFEATHQAGATVLRTPDNRGKGAALKSGFRHLLTTHATGAVVTADADGQHAVADILAVAAAVDADPGTSPHLVLGERAFDTTTPSRSRIGNTVTRWLFRAATGRRLHDTQTGLRAFPTTLLPWLSEQPGQRYDYELTQLLHAVRAGIELRSVPIATIYEDGNAGSHFRPIADSMRIYAPLLMFLTSSFSAFLLDSLLLLAFAAMTSSLVVSVVGARVISATVNFGVNRNVIFRGEARWIHAARRYAALAAGLLAANYLVLNGMVSIGLPLLPAKVATEVLLVVASYAAQATYVYGQARNGQAATRLHDLRPTAALARRS